MKVDRRSDLKFFKSLAKVTAKQRGLNLLPLAGRLVSDHMGLSQKR